MPRFLPLLAFLSCALQATAAPSESAPPPQPPPPPSAVPVQSPADAPSANTGSSPQPAAATPSQSPAPAPAPVFSAVQKFDRALTAYNAGSYDDARRDFLELVAEGHLSASLAHNLANLEYKSGHDGLASLWYRRSLAMQPFSVETLQNLRFLRRKHGFQTFDPYGISWSHFAGDTAKNVTLLAAWAFLIFLIWLLWSPPRPGRRWPLVTLLLLCLPVLSISGPLWFLIAHDEHPLEKRYVLTAGDAAAYASPAEASSQLISLPEGGEVVPLESRGNWFYCDIPTDTSPPTFLRGWVRSAQVTPLWPYAAAPRG